MILTIVIWAIGFVIARLLLLYRLKKDFPDNTQTWFGWIFGIIVSFGSWITVVILLFWSMLDCIIEWDMKEHKIKPPKF